MQPRQHTQPATAKPPPLLSLRGIDKHFPGVRALFQAQLDLWPGEIHVLFGENGAGKSTLINLIAGVYPPDAGQMHLNGSPLRLRSVQDARRLGIAAMFQEFSLAPQLTVAQNLLLGNEPRLGGAFSGLINHRQMRRLARQALDAHGFDLNLDSLVGSLGRAEQQMVEMAKAMLAQPKILILDEPTASLSEREAQALFRTLEALKSRGVAIVYITHRLREIRVIADRVTVMRDGSFIACLQADEASEEQLIELMTGRKVGDLYPPLPATDSAAREVLRADKLTTRDGSIRDISFVLRAGEILGLAGLVGCGKSEIGRACFGLHPLSTGTLTLNGEHVKTPTPRRMLAHGLCYITSDRRFEGLLLQRPVRENMALSALPHFSRHGVLSLGEEKRQLLTLAGQLQLRPLNLAAQAAQYSGGNQQKILIGRALARSDPSSARVLIFDEPTVGVDVGARVQIYQALTALAQQGCAILLISSDMPEILNLCHRVHVVRDGRLVDHLQGSEIVESRILRGFFQDEAAQAAHAEDAHA